MTTNKKNGLRRAAKVVMAQQWAITPQALESICMVASGMGDVKALMKQNGGTLKNNPAVVMRDGIAILSIDGPLFKYANLMTEISGATSYQMFVKDFTQAVESDEVKAIILDIDSPGGMTNGMTETSQIIRDARGIKPIYSYIGGTGASAAYGLACAADHIICEKSALVGSIGVILSVEAGEDGDINIISKNAPNKRPDINTAEGRQSFQTTVDDLETVFIDHVAACRGIDRETVVSDFGQGGILVGEKALEAGMVDSVGSLESLVANIGGTQRGIVMDANPKAEGEKPTITAEYILANHREIATQFRSEGAKGVDLSASVAKGASDERERIQSVFAASMVGHEDLIQSLAFDGKTTGGEAALKVIGAARASGATKLQAISKDLEDAPKAGLEQESQSKGWEDNAALRAEWNDDKASYDAYTKATEAGLVRTTGVK